MFTLKNKYIEAKFDENARLVSLKRKGSDNIILRPANEGFRAVMAFVKKERLENLAVGSRQSWKVNSTNKKLEFVTEKLIYSDGLRDDNVAPCKVVLRVELEGEAFVFTSEVENGTEAHFIDFEFPRVGELKDLGDGIPTLFVPRECGRAIVNPGARVSNSDSREQQANTMEFIYPGHIAMAWLALCGKRNCLFLEGNDATFSATAFRVVGRLGGNGAMTMLVDRFASVNPKASMSHSPVKLKFYEGDWRRGAAEYAEWLRPYRPQHTVPQWVMDMQGYYLVINKQQSGYELWPYDTLPDLYRYAQECGYDVIGLFGWFEGGHDNRYPDQEVSRTLGGAAALKKNIREVQKAGGHVTLYFEGHLIDLNSDFYKHDDSKSTLRTIWGQEYVEFYDKPHQSGYLADFSHKCFALACPSTQKWRDFMVEREDWLASFGADGTLYDQIGGIVPYVCFAKSHDHDGDSPARAMSGGRRKLLDSLQAHSKEISPDFAFSTEHLTDIYSSYLDFLHGIEVCPLAQGAEALAYEHPEQGGEYCVPQMFRASFPEVKVTIRNPRPYTSRRYVNFAFAHSFLLEQELRYRADVDDTRAETFAAEHAYAKLVSAFRRKHWDILGYGTYVDDKFATSSNPSLFAVSYENGDQRAITIWNDSDKPADLSCLHLASGVSVKEYLTPEGKSAKRLPARLAANSVALVLLN
ncbi:MAG: hypothetical protein IJS15_14770 [Victivallales bacterium]|nr:hypothetical protein [Victivallales bacterium]